MPEEWMRGRWITDFTIGGLRHIREGMRDPLVMVTDDDFDVVLHSRMLDGLIEALEESGWLKPRLDDRIRNEDLKVTHRILDILDKAVRS